MQLLDHVSLTVPDLARARPFYHAIFNALGAVVVYDHADAIGYGERCERSQPGHSYLTVRASAAPLSADPGRHWCFKAASHAQVRAFHAAALAHGGEDDGPPGLRVHYHADYYAAFVRDPFGNRLEAVCHGDVQPALSR